MTTLVKSLIILTPQPPLPFPINCFSTKPKNYSKWIENKNMEKFLNLFIVYTYINVLDKK